jgi:hypothetical protein
MGFREEALRDLHTVGSIRENGDQDEADTLHQYGGRLIIAGAVASFCLTGVLYLTEARVPAGAQADWGLLFSETLKLRASSMFEVSILTG